MPKDTLGSRAFARLLIPQSILDAMILHARQELPDECCGLLAGVIDGDIGRVKMHFPIRNSNPSPISFATDAADMLCASRAIRAEGAVDLAIYHSHPLSTPIPSRRDVEDNTYGESVMHVIVGLGVEVPDIRAWRIVPYGFFEADWELSDEPEA